MGSKHDRQKCVSVSPITPIKDLLQQVLHSLKPGPAVTSAPSIFSDQPHSAGMLARHVICELGFISHPVWCIELTIWTGAFGFLAAGIARR